MRPPNTEQTRPVLELGKRRGWEEALVTLCKHSGKLCTLDTWHSLPSS